MWGPPLGSTCNQGRGLRPNFDQQRSLPPYHLTIGMEVHFSAEFYYKIRSIPKRIPSKLNWKSRHRSKDMQCWPIPGFSPASVNSGEFQEHRTIFQKSPEQYLAYFPLSALNQADIRQGPMPGLWRTEGMGWVASKGGTWITLSKIMTRTSPQCILLFYYFINLAFSLLNFFATKDRFSFC